MQKLLLLVTVGSLSSVAAWAAPTNGAPNIPRFSIEYMDKSVAPGDDFFHYADGTWIKNNPVPPDKARWVSFTELQERNWYLIHQILDSTVAGNSPANSPPRKVGDFFRSAMDTNRIEQLGFKPIEPDLKRITDLKTTEDLLKLLADFHYRGIGGIFGDGVGPDEKNSSVYAFSLSQGGLGLPDRDYYLSEGFAQQREAYVAHVAKMFGLLGEKPAEAQAHAATILELETALAKASRTRVELRDPIANYNKFSVGKMTKDYAQLPLKVFLTGYGLDSMPELNVRQPQFFASLDKLVKERPLTEWQTYLRWHLLHSSAPYLQAAVEQENFAFYGKVLSGQQEQEPR